jgi:hypothetical protein
MALETPLEPRSRRALLGAAIGAAVATVATALGRPMPVKASEGDVLHVGDELLGTTVTKITTGSADALHGASASGVGVQGTSGSYIAVRGDSTTQLGVAGLSTSYFGLYGSTNSSGHAGILGQSLGAGLAIYGYSGPGEPPSGPPKTGVYGLGIGDGSSRGVVGETTAGTGVLGISASDVGVQGTSTSYIGVRGNSSSQIGVAGQSTSFIGVYGSSEAAGKPGILGQSISTGTAIHGYSGPNLPPNPLPKTGVFGYAAQDSASRGVVGQATTGTGMHGYAGAGIPPAPSTKTGVYGRCDIDANARGVSGSSGPGTGLYGSTSTGAALLGLASSSSGFGLKSTGRVSLSKASGVATILAGNTVVQVTPGTDIVSGTFIILTAQADPGTRRLWATTNITTNVITLHASSAVTSDLKVAWLALD